MKTFYIPNHIEQLTVMNEPKYHEVKDKAFIVYSSEETDFWLKTHYGFEVMNGHVFYEEVSVDFQAEVSLRMNPRATYDQAGLFVMLSEECWLKTSLEYIPEGPSHLGAVVTNSGYSDWSTQNFSNEFVKQQLRFRIIRKNGDYTIYVRTEQMSDDWEQVRIAHLMEDRGNCPVKIGFYTCSPSKNNGFETEFFDFIIEHM
ncbi:hypothetical protein CON65_12105 [Bacillus pseudomycoides]|uniref:DUF1349 domain-containing protein n=1 Tax=Bacillus pseudomycoides TaxID=64104 RepID=A0AA91VCH3_9BACI|nr:MULTISPECIES: DUF1349 domain-containing protein [Bacillus]PEB55440.1 hypothetical protein COO03_02620 [Bacillus sp. AFS098217]PED82499.1 hypothetical protein CON65_12105 [Bacillus pseudomycoides]PEU09914.1 hypothetical protein CN525_24185 [Bacillus sp. AFS014408]PEU10097.1 hypothetical protein CN524_17120 [Bacillus sp. AFS019443]PFW60067.1 hypothetical protein COL20_23230 [Bacillus sp. AFS075034]